MLQILKQTAMVAKSSNTTVLIQGESGTGKELLARAIHYNSQRRGKKFVAINCAAISPHLIESELFGHEKGAFTGADKTKIGKFELAHEGTVFLDEIADLSLEAQAKVLRFLQEKEFERVGGTETIKTDVRVIGATNQDLDTLVKEGKFREDLYYRIKVFPIKLPPLRERRVDIIPLANHFLSKFSQQMGRPIPKLSEGAKNILLRYSWPGNIRELENAMERAVILCQDDVIQPEHLKFLVYPQTKFQEEGLFVLPEGGINLEELEKDLVKQALKKAKNNQSEAARLLGLTRGKFRSLLKHIKK